MLKLVIGKTEEEMAAKLARWVTFTIVFSLIPLVVDFLAEIARTNGEFSLSLFGRHGELYLLASAICAVGLGEIIGVNQKYFVVKILAGGASVIIITLATALYTISSSDAALALAGASKETNAAGNYLSQNLIHHSSLMFIFACAISTSCIALSGVE